MGCAKGKQVLRLQTNKTKLSKEGKEEGGEEENNLLKIWYMEKRKHDNGNHIHKYKQRKVMKAWSQAIWQLISSQILIWMCILLLGKNK